MYRHFFLRHVKDKMIILDDGEVPRCPKCGMFTKNVKGSRRRENVVLREKQAVAEKIKIKVYGKEIERVKELKYLGRIFTEDDDDSRSIEIQLKRARNWWNSIAKILKREGANAWMMGRFYVAIVQAVLLYGSDSWSVTEQDWKSSGGSTTVQ